MYYYSQLLQGVKSIEGSIFQNSNFVVAQYPEKKKTHNNVKKYIFWWEWSEAVLKYVKLLSRTSVSLLRESSGLTKQSDGVMRAGWEPRWNVHSAVTREISENKQEQKHYPKMFPINVQDGIGHQD